MRAARIFTAGTVGTAVMTLFSYAASKAANKNFVEPEILSQLIHRVTKLNRTNSEITGWAAHLGMGYLFTAAYENYLTLRKTDPTLANTLLLGLAGGATGVALWDATFRAHPNPPGIDVKSFYKQLIVAHMVFATGVATTYKLDNAKPKDQ